MIGGDERNVQFEKKTPVEVTIAHPPGVAHHHDVSRPFGTRQPAVLHRAERSQNEVHAGLVSGQHHENVIRPAACQHLVDLLRRSPFAIYHPLVGIASYDGFHLPFESGIVHVRRDEDDVLVTFEKRAHLLITAGRLR